MSPALALELVVVAVVVVVVVYAVATLAGLLLHHYRRLRHMREALADLPGARPARVPR